MDSRFVLLTAAKNEEEYIEHAIRSVVRQTILPLAWYIVDDGSVDRTAEIVRNYSKAHPFIRLICNEIKRKRSFGAQYRAINSAYALVQPLEFEFIGVQDADVALERDDYYEQILAAFSRDARLGLTGGYIFERQREQWRCRLSNAPDSVAGGIQMFRRACFDQIGAYSPLLFGGEDWLAQIDAKRSGWSVYPLPGLAAHHYRPSSSAEGQLKGLFRVGMRDGSFGSHPVFEFFKCARRVPERPLLVGGVVRFGGYLWWRVSRRSPLLPSEKSAYLRAEQLTKLRSMLARVGHKRDGARRG
jgi:glycosyltransferase involved in cell wall biosynthesis